MTDKQTDTLEGLMDIADQIRETLRSPNESDSNGEVANVVDGLFFIGRAIYCLAGAIQNDRHSGR